MKIFRALVLGLGFAAFFTAAATADVWDTGPPTDNNSGTINQVLHGAEQVHDLGVVPGPTADEDWYIFKSLGYSSYEVSVEGLAGTLGSNVALDYVDIQGTVLTPSVPWPGGLARSLRWENTTNISPTTYVRVRGAACGTSCTTNDQYTIRFFETTASIPRFNNAGGQVTVLILQNTSWQESAFGHIYFWSAAGTLLATQQMSLNAKQTLVLNTATLPGAQGVGGSITISSDAHFGQLSGKSVALEPSTGFSFDSPMLPKP